MINRKEKTKNYYENIATVYNQLHGIAKPGGDFCFENYYNSIVEEFIPSSSNVLEFGCGTGRLTSLIKRGGHKITATDIAPNMIEVAKKYYDLNDVEFIISDTENLYQNVNKTFDVTIGLNTFSYCQNKQKALEEIYKCTKPGGKIILIDMNYLCPLYHFKGMMLAERYYRFIKELIQSQRFYLSKLFKQNGIEIETIREFLWVPHSASARTVKIFSPISRTLDKIPLINSLGMRILIVGRKK